jgi:hypothetical protein
MLDYFENSKAPTIAATYDATISSSTVVTLNSGTSYIAVSAIDKGIFMKWAATASSSSFDEFIPANSTNVYVVPNGTTTVQFIEEVATAKLICIEK